MRSAPASAGAEACSDLPSPRPANRTSGRMTGSTRLWLPPRPTPCLTRRGSPRPGLARAVPARVGRRERRPVRSGPMRRKHTRGPPPTRLRGSGKSEGSLPSRRGWHRVQDGVTGTPPAGKWGFRSPTGGRKRRWRRTRAARTGTRSARWVPRRLHTGMERSAKGTTLGFAERAADPDLCASRAPGTFRGHGAAPHALVFFPRGSRASSPLFGEEDQALGPQHQVRPTVNG